jgi:internalin A
MSFDGLDDKATSVVLVEGGGTLSLEPLARFKKAVEVAISDYKKLEHLDALGKLPALEDLTLEDDRLADIGFLAGAKRLRKLALARNKLRDVTPLAKLVKLEVLDLGDNAVADVSALAGLAALKRLELRDNPVADLTPLKHLHALETLIATGRFGAGKLASVAPLSGLRKLSLLNIAHHPKLVDVAPLASCTALETLVCSSIGKRVAGFDALVAAPKLKVLVANKDAVPKADQAALKKKGVELRLS